VNIGKLAVTRPVAVTMRIAALVLLGIVSLTRLPLDLLPKVALPTVVVNTTWPNVAPEEMETQVTRPIEQAVSSASNVYLVSSQSSLGNSSVRIQFNYGTDISLAAVDVLQLVERARGRLPVDPTLQPPAVFRLNPSQLPILIFGVSGIDNPAKLKALLVDSVAPILQSAEGVASANVNGGADRAIIIDVDPAKLRAMGISMSTVSRRIVEENLNLPAGIAKQGATEYTIRSMGTIKSLETLRLLPIPTAGGQQVRLSDIAEIRDASRERRAYTRLMGENSVALTIVKQSEANTVETAANVRKKIEQVKRMYPELTFGVAYDQSTFIEHAVEDVKISAMIGSALAIAILMMFLRNFRSTMVVALSIPISIISTFTLFWLCGFTLNTLTLSGLSLATGLIVDDAVVVLENIFRHIERDKKSVHDAAIEGTNEITSAVVASTITIMVVFLPLFLIRGQAGQLFTQFALVVIFSIAVSLLDALTVVPMLASRMIKIDHNAAPKEKGAVTRFADWLGERFDALDHSYRDSLRIALTRRWVVILFALSLTGASLLLIPYIGQETLPQTDSGNLHVFLRMPVGTALSVTNQAMLTAEGRGTGSSGGVHGQSIKAAFAKFTSSGRSHCSGSSGRSTPSFGSSTPRVTAITNHDNRKHWP
jgi:HAE1 family hydrophobic/amphiphilic exporter-1